MVTKVRQVPTTMDVNYQFMRRGALAVERRNERVVLSLVHSETHIFIHRIQSHHFFDRSLLWTEYLHGADD